MSSALNPEASNLFPGSCINCEVVTLFCEKSSAGNELSTLHCNCEDESALLNIGVGAKYLDCSKDSFSVACPWKKTQEFNLVFSNMIKHKNIRFCRMFLLL